MNRWLGALLLTAGISTLAGGGAVAEPGRQADPSLEEVAERVDELASDERAGRLAERAIEHARRALERAEQDYARGDNAAGDRAVGIAHAAWRLADRRVALHQERGALEAAERRLERARTRRAEARRALEAAMAQRAELEDDEDDEDDGNEDASEGPNEDHGN